MSSLCDVCLQVTSDCKPGLGAEVVHWRPFRKEKVGEVSPWI